LGTSSFLNVVIVQRDTVNRELAEVNALNQYVRARVNVEEVTGGILRTYDVNIDEAKSGMVKREPDLPVAPEEKQGR
jgi:outer membrane protein TolC